MGVMPPYSIDFHGVYADNFTFSCKSRRGRTWKVELLHMFISLGFLSYITLVESSTGINQKLLFGINTTFELQNITTISDSNGTPLVENTPR